MGKKKKLSGAAVKTAVLGDFDYGFLCMVSAHRNKHAAGQAPVDWKACEVYLSAADSHARLIMH
jgi:hypothetical protein